MLRRLFALLFPLPQKRVIRCPPNPPLPGPSPSRRRPHPSSRLIPQFVRQRSNIPSAASLPWTKCPEKNHISSLLSIQNKLIKELQNPNSSIWRQDLEIEDKSAYPETFHCRGGLEIMCHRDKDTVMKWVRRELVVKGYKQVRVVSNGEGRYGSFTVSVEKPQMH